MSKPSTEEKEILVIDRMTPNTSYLKEELAYITGLSLAGVISQLKRLHTEGKIELTNTNGYEFWSKVMNTGNNTKATLSNLG